MEFFHFDVKRKVQVPREPEYLRAIFMILFFFGMQNAGEEKKKKKKANKEGLRRVGKLNRIFNKILTSHWPGPR